MEENRFILGCLQGDMQHFRPIVEKYKAPSMALAMNILGNREDAEDACQEAFIQVFLHRGDFDIQRNFGSWLYTILYRRCVDQLRKKRRFLRFFEKSKREPSLVLEPQQANCRRGQELFPAAIKHLSAKERTALSLWANDGYTSQEISQVMNCSASTVRIYLFHARKKIKTFLEKNDAACKAY
jgi:RNA polymerase sigma-70 factor (ECF subfamily)